jgi:hypothetical protein
MATPILLSRTRPPRPRRAPSPGPRPGSKFDRDDWFAHCADYRVDTAGGRLGFVEAVSWR